MPNRAITLFFVLTASSLFSACATPKKVAAIKNGSAVSKVIDATMQRTLPGAPGMEPQTEYRLLIVWKSTKPPESFFWRDDEAWLPCGIAKAHKRHKKTVDELWYTLEEVELNKIKKGDTLELMPRAGGKYPVPTEIPSSLKNTIFFKTSKSGWQYLAVKNIHMKEDIIMP
jgi:hypothetical protein